MMILNENNKDITELLKHLDSVIVEFRNKHPNHKSLKLIKLFYEKIVLPWMEEYKLSNIEVDDEIDEEIKNQILDLLNDIKNKTGIE